jgi:hypothetical protein
MPEQVTSTEGKKNRKIQYMLWMLVAFIGYTLSLFDPSIRGPKLWLMFFCMGFASWVSALKLRNLIHGNGWVFPYTNTILLWVVGIEALLYLWFSH